MYILDACDERRTLKKTTFEPEVTVQYKVTKCKVKTMMKKAKEIWVANFCGNTENSLIRNDSNKAYQLSGVRKMSDKRTGHPKQME